MPRSLKILTESGDWFLGSDAYQKYPIYYRYVICYSLLKYLELNEFKKDSGQYILQELKTHIDNRQHFRDENFLEIFPLQNEWGFAIVDQSNGIYPLIIYSENRERELGDVSCDERTVAFQKSLEDVIEKYNNIFNFINGKSIADWNQQFQEALFTAAGFKYPEQ